MATIAADAILTAIRDVIEDGAGTIRTISSASYQGGVYESLGADEESRRTMSTPSAEASIAGISKHPMSPSEIGNLALYNVDVTVRLVRHLNQEHMLDNATRDNVKALAVADGDVLRQALGWPGNLTQDSAANATGLVSGRLEYVSTAVGSIELDGESAGRLVTTHTLSGIAQVTMATS